MRNQDVARGLWGWTIIKSQKVFHFGHVLSKLVPRKNITNRPQRPWGCDFRVFRKNIDFNATWITFRTFLKPFEKTKLLKFESFLNWPLPLVSLTYRSSQKQVKTLAFLVKLSKWLGWGGTEAPLAPLQLHLSQEENQKSSNIFR